MTTALDCWTIRSSTSAGKNPSMFLTVFRSREHSTGIVPIVLIDFHSDSTTTVSPQKAEPMDGTSSGPFVVKHLPIGQSSSEAILELRRRSGLTWEQLSKLFDVSLRTVHYWANGRSPSSLHEKEIRNTLNAIQRLDHGSQRDTRNLLLSIDDGNAIFDLLAARKYEDVLKLAAKTTTPIAAGDRTSFSKDEWELRRPSRPELLLSAIQDRPKIPPNEPRVVKPLRVKRSTE